MLVVMLLLLVLFCAGPLHSGPATAALRRLGQSLAVTAILTLYGPARADARLGFADLQHTAWSLNQGAPSAINAIVQTPDGYLWLGSRAGLFRFDGVKFQAIGQGPSEQPHSDDIHSLLVTQAGELLVIYRHGGPAILRNGVLRPFPIDLHGADVLQMVQDRTGAIWISLRSSGLGLLRYSGGKLEVIGSDRAFQSGANRKLFLSREGVLWLLGGTSVQFLLPGAHRFEQSEKETDVQAAALFEDREDKIWFIDNNGARRLDHPSGLEAAKLLGATDDRSVRPLEALITTDGAFWGCDGTHGIFRFYPGHAAPTLVPRAIMESFRAKDGLTSDWASAVYQDREGNVWVGTFDGLDQFRPKPIKPESEFQAPAGSFFTTAADDEGNVYVSGSNAIFVIPPHRNPQPILSDLGAATYDICKGSKSGIWAITAEGITRWQKGTERHYPQSGADVAEINGCAEDENGDLWIADDDLGLRKSYHGRWIQIDLSGLQAVAGQVGSVEPDPQGGVNFVLSSVGIINVKDGHFKIRATFHDLGIGLILGLSQQGGDLFVSGQFGLARIADGITRSLRSEQYGWLRRTRGVIETKRGVTWIVSSAGILSLLTNELNAAFDTPGRDLKPRQFDNSEGLPPWTNTSGSEHVALEGGDGRIWIDAGEHIISVDADNVPHNSLPPPVSITSITAAGRQYAADAGITLPKGTANLQLAYTALSLTIPTHVQFKYRLLPYDLTWVDAGGRREAFYTNLSPGDYRFQVIASNNNGVWNRQGAALEFSILPTFFESTEFRTLCAAGFGGLLWLAYSLRTRQLTARVRSRLEVQLAERERIARELHDTLLQGFQGLVLRFQSVANRIPQGEPIRDTMEETLERAENVLVEGRNRVSQLRSMRESSDLAQALTATAADLAVDRAARFTLTVEGRMRELAPLVRVEVLRIGEEAVGNAFRHANAAVIDAVLIYGVRELQLGIRDDGVGLPDDVVAAGKRAGHFGLIGMRERAQRAGGVLSVTSRQGSGTEIRVLVPGRLAYKARSPWKLGWRTATRPPTED